MGYRVLKADGSLAGGDGVLDDGVRDWADEVAGWVEDDQGEVVYESPQRASSAP